MRIRVPDSPVSSPQSSPPSSPLPRRTSLDQRTPVKHARSSTSSRATPIAGPSSESKRHRRRESSSPRTKLSERNVSEEPTSPPPRDCSWEELEFYNAVKQRLKPDPLEEYEAKEREIAWQEAREQVSEIWKPVTDILSSVPTRSEHFQRTLEDVHDSQVAELDQILRHFQLEDNKRSKAVAQREKAEKKKFWDALKEIETTIAREEERLAKIAAEREAARRAEEERLRKIKEAEEAKRRAEEAEAKKKADAEAALKKKLEEEKEKRRQAEEAQKKKLEQERLEEEKKRKEAEASKGVAPSTALTEWERIYSRLRDLKTQIMPLVRGNKGDDSMINAEWRKTWGNIRRSFVPKIGQVTNSQSEIDRIAGLIHTSLNPTPTHPPPLYMALLSSLAKVFLLQAETEVTAKASTAYPLARLLIKIVEMGNPLFPDVFMARLVGRTGGWSLGCAVPKYPNQTDADYRKTLGYPSETSGETSIQVADRFCGMLTLYAAVLQNSNSWASSQNVAPLFQLPRLWIILARIANTPRLITDRMAPQIIVALIETAGMRLMEIYGKQVTKLVTTLWKRCQVEDGDEVVGGKEGKAGRVRLGLLLEKWRKEGKIGGVGRDVGP